MFQFVESILKTWKNDNTTIKTIMNQKLLSVYINMN